MSRVVIWLFLVVSLVLLSIPATSLADETVCLQCHAGLSGHLSAPVADWQNSVHAENGISCHDCHGGDPTDMAMAKSPDRGFVGAPDYTEVPDFCGRCHIGVAEEYKAGAHGKAIEEGGAQCVICHGNHAVKKASLALINEEDCTRCHSYERAALIRLSLVETDTMIKDVATGGTLNSNYLDCKVSTHMDSPNIVVDYVETIDYFGPMGAKGVSEPTFTCVAPAITNAIYNACGVRLTRNPATPDIILAGLGKA